MIVLLVVTDARQAGSSTYCWAKIWQKVNFLVNISFFIFFSNGKEDPKYLSIKGREKAITILKKHNDAKLFLLLVYFGHVAAAVEDRVKSEESRECRILMIDVGD